MLGCSFNAVASSMLSLQLLLLKRTEGFTVLHNIAMPSFLARTRNLMFMDCKKHYFYRHHLCHYWDKIPGPGQGWRFAGTVQCLVDVFPTLLFIKNAVQGTANILHDGQVDVRTEACLCTHRQMNIICILMFFCSYVWIKKQSYCATMSSFLTRTRNLMFMDCRMLILSQAFVPSLK